MSDNLPNTIENSLLNLLLRGTPFVVTAPVRARLMTANGTSTTPGTELATSGGYTAGGQAITFGNPANNGSIFNTVTCQWLNMPATTIRGVEIWSTDATPKRLWFGPLAAPVTLTAGQTFEFPPGTVAAALGALLVAPPPLPAPIAPTGLVVTSVASGTVSLDWEDIPNATSYTVYQGTGTGTVLAVVTASQATITGLTNGTAYTFTVRATNTSGGSGASSSVTATPIVPSGSNDFTVLPGNRPAYPNATNTGVPDDGRTLTVNAGDYTTSANGEDIYNLVIRGDLIVKHDNVKLRYCKVKGRVTIDPSAVGFQTWYSTLYPPDTTIEGQTLGNFNYTARRCQLQGAYDGFRIVSPGVVDIQDCYVHDLLYALDAFYGPGQFSHNDGVKYEGGAGIRFVHNRVDCWMVKVGEAPGAHFGQPLNPSTWADAYQNSGLMITAKNAAISNVLIDDNIFQGPAYKYINFGLGNTTYTFANIVISNNHYTDMTRDLWTNAANVTPGSAVSMSGNAVLAAIVPVDGQPVF